MKRNHMTRHHRPAMKMKMKMTMKMKPERRIEAAQWQCHAETLNGLGAATERSGMWLAWLAMAKAATPKAAIEAVGSKSAASLKTTMWLSRLLRRKAIASSCGAAKLIRLAAASAIQPASALWPAKWLSASYYRPGAAQPSKSESKRCWNQWPQICRSLQRNIEELEKMSWKWRS